MKATTQIERYIALCIDEIEQTKKQLLQEDKENVKDK